MTYKEQFEAAKAAGRVQGVSPVWTRFEKEGDTVCGQLLGSSEVPSGLGTGSYLQYLMRTDDGLIKFSLGAATDRELAVVLKMGELYRIEFDGQTKIKGGKRVNRFLVDAIVVPEEEEITAEDVPF